MGKLRHTTQGTDHILTIANCPRCKSMRVHKRRGFHLLTRWGCRKCHLTFIKPKWREWIYYKGTESPKYAIEAL